jgi:hypothetical protein
MKQGMTQEQALAYVLKSAGMTQEQYEAQKALAAGQARSRSTRQPGPV